MEIDDQALIRQTLAGKSDAFRKLVEKHHPSVFRFAFSLLGNREDAQDIVQDTFLAAYRALARFDATKATLSTWLFTITRNRCINLLKKKRPLVHAELDLNCGKETADPISQQELFEQLDRALADLPHHQRIAFVLAEIEERPYEEIAKIENVSLGTVKSRIHRAKQKLQILLDASENPTQ